MTTVCKVQPWLGFMAKAIGALTVGCMVSAPVAAKIVTVSGEHFDLVYDTAQVRSLGTPGLSGDTIFFSPTDFAARATNIRGNVMDQAAISLTLVAKDGHSFGGLSLVQMGSYQVQGDASVGVSGQLFAFDPANPLGSYSYAFLNASPDTPLDLADNTMHAWEVNASLDPTSAAFNAPQRLVVGMQSLLLASSQSRPGLAAIQGSLVGLHVAAVPEPETIWMFVMGLLTFGWIMRRR